MTNTQREEPTLKNLLQNIDDGNDTRNSMLRIVNLLESAGNEDAADKAFDFIIRFDAASSLGQSTQDSLVGMGQLVRKIIRNEHNS